MGERDRDLEPVPALRSAVSIVLVHGVPDTTAMWDPLVDALARDDVVRLALPGFATPVPEGFSCTKEAYTDWVVGQLEAIGEPVDVVGHDWGSLLVQRVAVTRPDLVRSYTLANAVMTETFRWHDLAVAWQTPEVGEQVMEAMVGDALAQGLREGGHPDAARAAEGVDATMKACILGLYRSAIDIATEWSPREALARPGLVLWGSGDPFAPPDDPRLASAVMDAELALVDGGHWAIVEHPTVAANALTRLWATA